MPLDNDLPSGPPPTSRRLRIDFYIYDLSGGGAERAMLALFHAWETRHQVRVFMHRNAGELAGLLPAGVARQVLGTSRTLADVPALVRLLRREPPDVLISVLDHNNVAAMLAHAFAGSAIPLVICQQRALDTKGVDEQGWKFRAVPLFYRVLARHAAAAVSCSSGVSRELVARAGIRAERAHTIYNPIIDDDFALRAAAPPPHPWLTESGAPVFVTAGRLVAQKDQAMLLHALAHPLAPPGARLIVLGTGKLREPLLHLAAQLGLAERVAMVGFQMDPLPWMRHASAFLLSSRLEGFGNVLVEALGCGTPVVSTDCPFGPNEILRDGQFGHLVPVGDVASMARAMSEDLRASFPAPMLQARAAEFSKAACVGQYEALLQRLCDARVLA